MSKKFTNDDVDDFLVKTNRLIKRNSCYISNGGKMKWICLYPNCEYNWETSFSSLKNHNNGCPKCSGNLPLSNDYIDNFLIQNNKLIKREDNYINSHSPMRWKCLKDNSKHTWSTSFNHIKNSNSNCPKCMGYSKYTNDDIDNYLKYNNILIERLGDYNNILTKMSWQCLNENCKHIWNACYNNIFNNNSGCPKCAGKIKFTNDDVDKYLLDNNKLIIRLDEYVNIKEKIRWKCIKENCKHEWKTSFGSIKTDSTGCPECAPISKGEEITRNLLKELNIRFKSQFPLILPHNELNFHSRIDFYLPDYNLFIEINGLQHYKPIKFNSFTTDEKAEEQFIWQKIRDQNLRDYCKENNFFLEEIKSSKYRNKKKLEEYLEKILKIEK